MRRKPFDLSFYNLLTGDMGGLYPAGLVEVLPGDIIRHGAAALVRFSPMIKPIMHPVTVRVHHFFVPNRIINTEADKQAGFNWEDHITGGKDGTDNSRVPQVQTTRTKKDLLDYLGVPPVDNMNVSALPLRGANAVFNEWFRDQDIIVERQLEDLTVPNIAWAKDYFSTARLSPQKGDAITLPLGVRAPVKGIGTSNTPSYSARDILETDATQPRNIQGAFQQTVIEQSSQNAGYPNIWADLTEATAATVNDLRRSLGLQRFAEERQRYGSRYVEYLMRLGARPIDGRLQRPEYLGGSSTRVNISEVLQTAPEATPDTTYGVGDFYGHGIAMVKNNGYVRRFDEHGYIHTFVSVRPKSMYANGVDRTWLRNYREDWWQPELAFIGQQQVMQREVYAAADNETQVFGWSDRYAEYRSGRSKICGEFRDELRFWHLGRDFGGGAPALNPSFINCVPSKRIFNVQTNDTLWMTVQHKVQALRRMPKNPRPRIL